MAGLPRPTGQSVRTLHEKLIKDWSDRIAVDEEYRDLVHQENPIELLPDTINRNMEPIEIHSGRAGGVVDHANGLLMAMPTVHADPMTLGTEESRETEQVERVLAQLFKKHLLANDFWPSVGRDVLIYARAFLMAMPLDQVWTAQEGYPVRRANENGAQYLTRVRKWKDAEGKFPFVIQHIPALQILPHLDNQDNVLATIEEKWVTAKTLAEEFGNKEIQELINRRSLNWYDELSVVQYIDLEWVGYFLASTEPRQRRETDRQLFQGVKGYTSLRVWKHNLGKHPIVMIPGIRTELQDYEHHFKSFLADAKDAFETYDFLLSRLATMVYAYYLPSYEWKLSSPSSMYVGRDRPVQEVHLGGVTVTYADETLSPLPFPTGLPDAGVLLQQVDDVIQRHTLEDVLFGRVAGSAPAFQVSLRINVAKSKLSPIAQHMAQGLTNVFELFLRGVESLGEAVSINGETITTKMATKYRTRVAVSILPKSPVDRNQDIGAANMALQFGLPWDWIAENILDIEDPATLRLQKDIAEIENLPPVKERLMADALEELEALIEEDEFIGADGIDLQSLPPEFAQALQGLMGGAGGGETEMDEAIRGLASPGEGGPAGAGVGRGPFPEGAAPQTLQGGRGLLTPKTQPSPGGGVDTSALGALGMLGG